VFLGEVPLKLCLRVSVNLVASKVATFTSLGEKEW
jgi:hypothetical protein